MTYSARPAYAQAFAGPFPKAPPGTVVEVQPLAGFAGAFPGSAGPFVSSPVEYPNRTASAWPLGADVATMGAQVVTPQLAIQKPAAVVAATAPVPAAAPAQVAPSAPAASSSWSTYKTVMTVGGWVGSIAGAYHGYKRNESIGWAIGWSLLGGAFWPIALPVMAAQGFGKPLPKVATANRRKAKRNGFKVRTGDLVPLGRLGDIDDSQRDLIAYRDTSGWDFEVRKFASRSSMKEFLKKEARKSDYGAHGKRDWRALVKDIVGKNMVAYPSFEKEG